MTLGAHELVHLDDEDWNQSLTGFFGLGINGRASLPCGEGRGCWAMANDVRNHTVW